MSIQPVGPIDVVALFPELHTRLIALFQSLTVAEWQAPTVCAPWTVKDLAAHLLQGDLGRLTYQRDRWQPPQAVAPLQGYTDVLTLINHNNQEWVQAAGRISPALLIQFHEVTGPQLCEFFARLDPFQPAPISVLWAGEESSLNWFDIAREYTEKWLHQQQIREAVGRPGLFERALFHPVLDTFLRGLPYAYRDTQADNGTEVGVHITGEAGGDWTLLRQGASWRLYSGAGDHPSASVTLDQDTAWRLFTKGIPQTAARERILIEGDNQLGEAVLETVSIMA